MSDIQETMAKERKAADTMQAILEGQTRTVRILTYTKAQLPWSRPHTAWSSADSTAC